MLEGSEPHQQELFHLADDLTQLLEASAQRYSALIIAKLAQTVDAESPETDYHSVDINHVEALQARSIGVESLAWHALQQLQLDQKLTALGFNKVELAAAVGSIIARVVSPAQLSHKKFTCFNIEISASGESVNFSIVAWKFFIPFLLHRIKFIQKQRNLPIINA